MEVCGGEWVVHTALSALCNNDDTVIGIQDTDVPYLTCVGRRTAAGRYSSWRPCSVVLVVSVAPSGPADCYSTEQQKEQEEDEKLKSKSCPP